FFNAGESAASCASCAQEFKNNGFIKLNAGCRKWLSAVEKIGSSQLQRYSMDNQSHNEAKAFVTAVLSGVFGKRLASWDW
ncbi:MAG: hypothetical protein FWC01_07555, partial [Treponema sp.]|nr:hypothetical protein [Treponema sp.]MCL2237700.1 hypothetical protein [Treponema sp.]